MKIIEANVSKPLHDRMSVPWRSYADEKSGGPFLKAEGS